MVYFHLQAFTLGEAPLYLYLIPALKLMKQAVSSSLYIWEDKLRRVDSLPKVVIRP